ncbi:hypothetical protein HYH03_001380 [Edaphochlamys debaryana]|uniref:Uncharacterized protein n=1 Tax=Edaphochlamys debaryana TaxID=47281 RepID=A0A835YDB9_9CHLO|nr:hypothetical protein HYH03_001380 [Edaphochlamys debaryana]|eukprot:KAG2500613.1 hypothetical protein HYH03_001380 [Edaphochlamys debaryana]
MLARALTAVSPALRGSLHVRQTCLPLSRVAQRKNVLAHASAASGGAEQDAVNVFLIDGKLVERPLGAVQRLSKPLQAAFVAAVYGALGLGTWAWCAHVGPAIAAAAPGLHAFFVGTRMAWLGALFTVVGVAHFTAHDVIKSMYPKQGSWGFWSLPGSASFHTNWTGVAEVLGGGALLLAWAVPSLLPKLPAGLLPLVNKCLFALTLAVTPANIYMCTHNAPGPSPALLPWPVHLWRLVMQVVLLSSFWDMAHP